MKKVKFIVEKNQDGYWARHEDANVVVGAYADTLPALKIDMVAAYNLYQEDAEKKITEDGLSLQFDVTSFFELYGGVIAAAGIGQRAGMQKTLISAYVNGKRKPSKKQIDRLLTTINELGRELTEIEIA